MSRFTTDTQKYFSEIINKLCECTLKPNETKIFTYCEASQLGSKAFSVSLTFGDTKVFKIKKWNPIYEEERFRIGIYNLDQLAISECQVLFNEIEHLHLLQLLDTDLATIKNNSVILDGLCCKFIYGDTILIWNTNEQMNDGLYKLVSCIKKQVVFS